MLLARLVCWWRGHHPRYLYARDGRRWHHLRFCRRCLRELRG